MSLFASDPEDALYDERGRCEMCGAHKRDHGVGGVCPQERGPSDPHKHPVNPKWWL